MTTGVRKVDTRPPRAVGGQRRPYRKAGIEITSIEFVPMSEAERQRAIAVLAELFLPLLQKAAPEQEAA
ncbi:MAG: hypothetical protein ACYDA0_13225 [Candidatus Dormibacteraceae bacterium]